MASPNPILAERALKSIGINGASAHDRGHGHVLDFPAALALDMPLRGSIEKGKGADSPCFNVSRLVTFQL